FRFQMGRSAPTEKFVALCVGKGRLYRIGGNADEVQCTEDEVERPLRIGQWVMVRSTQDAITNILEVEDYVPTEVRNGLLFLDVKIKFLRSPEDYTLQLARCSELSEDIFVPDTMDPSVFDFDQEYGMIITVATDAEKAFYRSETGSEIRWKLFLGVEETFQEVHKPPKPPKKRVFNGEETESGVIRRAGIIVGVSGTGRTLFVFTPEEPVGMDGLLSTGLGETIHIGDWIKFDVDAEEAHSIFLNKEKMQFNVLDYRKIDPLLPTLVNDKK
ncbi:hypothetical protein PENTCL1PPCAC_18231, partial [Pristionchus entomophagus]